MTVKTEEIQVKTKADLDIVDITEKVSSVVSKSKIKNGIVNIFVPGSTASISTMEYEPGLLKDIPKALEKIAPLKAAYEHHKTWDDRNGNSHVRATLLGPGINVPFKNGKLLLGTWQQIVLLDFDVPERDRRIILQIVGD